MLTQLDNSQTNPITNIVCEVGIAHNRLDDCLVLLIIMSHTYCHFKFQNRTQDAKSMRSHSEDSLSLFIQSHMLSQPCYLWNVKPCLYLEPKSNFIVTHVFLVYVLNNEPCHILLKYKVCRCYLTTSI